MKIMDNEPNGPLPIKLSRYLMATFWALPLTTRMKMP
jgi:hypothetical protein